MYSLKEKLIPVAHILILHIDKNSFSFIQNVNFHFDVVKILFLFYLTVQK